MDPVPPECLLPPASVRAIYDVLEAAAPRGKEYVRTNSSRDADSEALWNRSEGKAVVGVAGDGSVIFVMGAAALFGAKL